MDNLKFFPEILCHKANTFANNPAITFIDKESKKFSTYRQLAIDATAFAQWFLTRNLKPARVLLFLPPGITYLSAFAGCLGAGMIAVPCYPPRNNHHLLRLQAILHDANADFIITTEKIASRFNFTHTVIIAEEILTRQPAVMEPLSCHADDIAFLQYTSGSSGDPKGVIVTHAMLSYNINASMAQYGDEYFQTCCSWLPPYHDMGLLLGLLAPIYAGGHSINMAPTTFLSRPVFWLETISHYRVQFSIAPNFAYDYCWQNTTSAQKQALDLTCWKVAANGSEPISANTLQQFSAAFARCGFNALAFCPSYGMAENTLGISAVSADEPPKILHASLAEFQRGKLRLVEDKHPHNIALVSCGKPLRGQTIRIVQQAEEKPANCLGEIWLKGPSCAPGYWQNPKLSEQTFHAALSPRDQNYLRTGDLGFLDTEGHLYIADRLTDRLSRYGMQYAPSLIEQSAAACCPDLIKNAAVAFAVETRQQTQFILVSEIHRHAPITEQLFSNILSHIVAEHQVFLDKIILIRQVSLPKTSSGKVQRRLCKHHYLRGDLQVIASWEAPTFHQNPQPLFQQARPRTETDILTWLSAWLKIHFARNVDAINPQQSLHYYGVTSISLAKLSADLHLWLGQIIQPTLLFEHHTIADLTTALMALSQTNHPARVPSKKPRANDNQFAIVGMNCRLADIEDLDAFWHLLLSGKTTIENNIPFREGASLTEINAGSFIHNIELFDAHFFNCHEKEAIALDPQQRLLLECSWRAFENAGIDVASLSGSGTGVFIGISTHDYGQQQQFADRQTLPYINTGHALSTAAGRLAYFYNFLGPALAIDTACASSLSAIVEACLHLQATTCDLAVAGGVNVILSQQTHQGFVAANMLSTTGECAPFAQTANGYVRGEGCGVILLKRLSDAIEAGDRVLAIITGVAQNQDGFSNGLTAPNGKAQVALMQHALQQAQCQPHDISFIETHGTGTRLGDAVEGEAIGNAYLQNRPNALPLYLGTLKATIGHCEAAAGVMSVIKTVLMCQHRAIAPNRSVRVLNSFLKPFAEKLLLPTEITPWQPQGVRCAAISCFGFSGTNVHLILQEAHIPSRRKPLPPLPFHREKYWLSPHRPQPVFSVPAHATSATIAEIIVRHFAQSLQMPSVPLDAHSPFVDMPLDSILVIRLLQFVEQFFNVSLSSQMLFNKYPTIAALADYIWAKRKPQRPPRSERSAITRFVQQFQAKTTRSRQAARRLQQAVADMRSFPAQTLYRELLPAMYPLVASRAQGAHLWDLDDNHYIDLCLGFGVHLFGHNPLFLNQALQQSLQNGYQLGPRSELIAEVGEKICRLTQQDRVAFAVTGTEAIMLAIRLARAATGKNKIVIFAECYHGHTDTVQAVNYQQRVSPKYLGIPPSAIQDTLVFSLHNPAACYDYIEKHSHHIAAVLLEPIPARQPALQTQIVCQTLRNITEKHTIALIFDEMITGFRVAPAGAQSLFAIKPDLSVYGKTLGGGLPLAVVAGREDYLRFIDGGRMALDDASHHGITLSAGTFGKHPLALVLANRFLEKIQQESPALQQQLHAVTASFVSRCNGLLHSAELPIQLQHRASMMRFTPHSGYDLSLFILLLIYHGIYIWEGQTCFLGTNHTPQDISHLLEKISNSIQAVKNLQPVRPQ